MVIVALDFDSEEKALSLARLLKGKVKTFKVGLELFSRSCRVVEKLSELGVGVFLDLKFFDIPNTVCSASRVAIESGVFMYNVHALGGLDFLRRVADFNREYSERMGLRRPLLLGVTILTSMDSSDLKSVGIAEDVESEVLRLSEVSREAGLDGVVCSAREVRRIKEELGEGFITVTPGIRPVWASRNDQKRVVTPSDAVRLGTDYFVIGRPITRSEDPLAAADRVLSEVEGALKNGG